MPLTLIGLDLSRLLRLCAVEGGSTLYLMSHARPALRVRGDIRILQDERAMSPRDIDEALIDFIPTDALDSAATTFACDIHGVGRVTCRALQDHRGPGVIFAMTPTSVLVATRLDLSPTALGLCDEPDGLVLVTGARGAGKSTLLAALVEHAMQNRRDFIVTIDEGILVVHESSRSLVSQREATGEGQAAAIHAAMDESADIVAVDELRTEEAARLALRAASSQLVLCALRAADAPSAVDAFVKLFPAEERAHVRETLAHALRGVIAQRLVRRNGEGRKAVRDLLLNTPAASAMIAAGSLPDLSSALESA